MEDLHRRKGIINCLEATEASLAAAAVAAPIRNECVPNSDAGLTEGEELLDDLADTPLGPGHGPEGTLDLGEPGSARDAGAVIPFHTDRVTPTITYTETPPQDVCTWFLFETYQQFQALRFAVEEINRNPEVLPNVTLGFLTYDSCSELHKELEGTLGMITGHRQAIPNYFRLGRPPMAAILGHSMSTYSILLAHILGLYRYPQVTHYIQNVRVKLEYGREVFFDKNGDLPAVYDIVNWQQSDHRVMKQVKVGSYDTAVNNGSILTINSSAMMWVNQQNQVPPSVCSESCSPGLRKVPIRGLPVCCYQCVPCPQGEISNQTDSLDCFKCPWDVWPNLQRDRCVPKSIEFLSYEEPLGATLSGSGITSFTVPLTILGLYHKKKNTPIIKANNYTLSCLLLVSLSCCFLSSLTFIGYPQSTKCFLRQATFGMVFALCISCVLSKTVMVVFAFMATKPGSSLRKWATPQVSYIIIICCSLLQFILCALWMSISPPFPRNDIQTYPGVIIAECNEGSPTAFWCMVGYLSLLASVSFIVAFLARRLPDSFNETKFITFSMLAFLSVWVSFIPASLSAQGKYTVAMEVFAIIFSTWALVICMFLPKCFIILFRPDMNSRESLLRKQTKLNSMNTC
ncbi:vomeronasal type-2 receptor 26-like [Mixophyes fleayi]|uniref:vomeronasal type-2 receptor 26-like n=1 Tax=Mixophyes fleayi TaxID=3061075 RepID=UPI003F4DB88D